MCNIFQPLEIYNIFQLWEIYIFHLWVWTILFFIVHSQTVVVGRMYCREQNVLWCVIWCAVCYTVCCDVLYIVLWCVIQCANTYAQFVLTHWPSACECCRTHYCLGWPIHCSLLILACAAYRTLSWSGTLSLTDFAIISLALYARLICSLITKVRKDNSHNQCHVYVLY